MAVALSIAARLNRAANQMYSIKQAETGLDWDNLSSDYSAF
jgi:hypothetical protein